MISLLKRAISRLKRAIPLFLKKLFKKHTFIVIFTFSEIRRSPVYGSVRFFFFNLASLGQLWHGGSSTVAPGLSDCGTSLSSCGVEV